MENVDVQPTLTIKYVDVDNNLSELMQVDNIKVENNKRIDYHTLPEIKKIEEKGYVLVENPFDPDGKSPLGEDAQTSYIITFRHGIEKVTLSNLKYGCKPADVQIKKKQIIHYIGAGNRTPRDNVSTVVFEKALFFDKITGKKINKVQWLKEKKTFPKIATPNVLGYIPDKIVVGGEVVKIDDENIEYTVTYAVNPTPSSDIQLAEVKYLDLDDANKEVATSGELIGMPNTKITYHTHDTIKRLNELGYTVISNDFDADKGIQFFDSSDNFTQIFIVALKHKKVIANKNHPVSGIDPITYEKEVARTIVYDGAEKNPINSLQVAKWERQVAVDLVTKRVIENDLQTTPWIPDKQEYEEVKNPIVPFYHTKEQSILKEKVTFEDIAHRVAYQKNGKIIPIDEAGAVIEGAKEVSFETDETDPTKVKNKMLAPVIEGYVPVEKEIIVKNPAENIELEYKIAHKYIQVDQDHPLLEVNAKNYRKKVLSTIHYEGAGNKTPEDIVQSAVWTRSVTFDEVSKKLVENGKYTTNWRKDKEEFDRVLTPAIDGYHADKQAIGPQEVGLKDTISTVTYEPNGRIIPVNSDGSEIPRAYHPSFITDPLDATKVFSIQSVPRILNYASKKTIVKISNASEDIKVSYYKFDRFKQITEAETFKLIFKDEELQSNTIGKCKAIVNFVDVSNNYQQLASSNLLIGNPGQKVTDLYNTKNQIHSLESKGYQLLENGFDANNRERVFSDDGAGIKVYTISFKKMPDPVLLQAQEKKKSDKTKKKRNNLFNWLKK